MKKITLNIKGMHCSSCPMMIEGTIEDTFQGVKSAQANLVSQNCIVEYDENEVETSDIIKAIQTIGYQAQLDLNE